MSVFVVKSVVVKWAVGYTNQITPIVKPGFHLVAGVFRVVTKYSKYPNDQVETSATNDSKYPRVDWYVHFSGPIFVYEIH